MLPVEYIRRKRDRKTLSEKDIHDFFGMALTGQVTDYQLSAMLMAIYLNGMNIDEIAALTHVMRSSGTTLDWSYSNLPKVDKHSTGGIGDKTSLILLPLCALHGVIVPMMSGRGLGHTGGTLDKLESIPGTDVFPSVNYVKALAQKHNGVFFGQTSELAPLDKKLYSLRDVTATVESIPLITASILSKKLAEGIQCLVMDVKFGSGAFMRKFEDAHKLADSILKVGTACGLRMSCLVTDMGSPLGHTAGHSLEIKECIDVMKGGGPRDTRDLSITLAEEMLCLALPSEDQTTIRKKLEDDIESGRCFEKFCAIIRDQGGDTSYLNDTSKFREAEHIVDVVAERDGAIAEIDVRALGIAVVSLGGGRRKTDDNIDHAVGLSQLKHVGDKVKRGHLIARVHANNEQAGREAAQSVRDAYAVDDYATRGPMIMRIIRS